MKHVSMWVVLFGVALAAPVHAADAAMGGEPSPMQEQDRARIYGYELMTPQERTEYRTQMRALKTEQEREAFRVEHHRKMQERAQAQGKTLPDMPPAGMGPGMMGPGGKDMGPGGRGGYGY